MALVATLREDQLQEARPTFFLLLLLGLGEFVADDPLQCPRERADGKQRRHKRAHPPPEQEAEDAHKEEHIAGREHAGA